MDYSLYMVVERATKVSNVNASNLNRLKKPRNVFYSCDNRLIYHVGIIDYLQTWNMSKKQEQFFKTSLLCWPKDKLSAVEPILYQKRWLNFMKSQILLKTNEKVDFEVISMRDMYESDMMIKSFSSTLLNTKHEA